MPLGGIVLVFGGSPLQMRWVVNYFSRSAEIGWIDKLTAFYFPSSIYGKRAHSILIFISSLIWICFFIYFYSVRDSVYTHWFFWSKILGGAPWPDAFWRLGQRKSKSLDSFSLPLLLYFICCLYLRQGKHADHTSALAHRAPQNPIFITLQKGEISRNCWIVLAAK